MESFDIHKYENILENSKFKKLNDYIAHGVTSTFKHCIDVAKLSVKIADKICSLRETLKIK